MADQAAANPEQDTQEGVITDEDSHEEALEEDSTPANGKLEENEEEEEEPVHSYHEENEDDDEAQPDVDLSAPQQEPRDEQQPYSGIAVPLIPPTVQYHHPLPPPSFPPQPPPFIMPPADPAMAMHSFYDARMRDCAAAYADAAAGKARAAAQIAQAAAEFAAGYGPPPPPIMLAHQPAAAWNAMMYAQQQPPPFLPTAGQQGYSGMYDYNNQYLPDQSYPQPYAQHHPKQQQQQPYYHDDGHGRKRQERPPSDNDSSSIPRVIHQPGFNNKDYKIRRRRLSNDSPSSSSGTGSFFYNSKYSQQNPNHRSSSSSRYETSHRSRHPSSQRHDKKKSRLNDLSSLIGKTAVAALFEWCGKRRCEPPSFLQEESEEATTTITKGQPYQCNYTCLVHVDGEEHGRGRGRTKAAARQDAAKQALSNLVPGVVFDADTGSILIGLPADSPRHPSISRHRAHSMDEELPNLAKRLAIGRDSENTSETDYIGDSKKKRLKSSFHQPKRAIGLYPASSTTASEDDELDENAYYKSKGASVCSVLLHAMVQITKISAPVFTYQITPLALGGDGGEVKGNRGQLLAVRATRGPFACRATLTLPASKKEASAGDDVDIDANTASTASFLSAKERVLEASGIGGTKREARQVASAELLALLFPECETMVEVMAAAEAMRERHAAAKALKMQHNCIDGSRRLQHQDRGKNDTARLHFAHCKSDDPEVSHVIQHELASLAGYESHLSVISGENADQADTDAEHSDALRHAPNDNVDVSSPDGLSRQLNRQTQLDLMVDETLQTLNERDDEGRSITELTEDDVGRTVLRKALPEDLPRIMKLLASGDEKSPSKHAFRDSSVCDGDHQAYFQDEYTSSSIVLLLCRAIAPHDDPPLGCSVLTLGFSMKHGRLLNIAHVASEPHLPKERFIECLFDFASVMKCHLEVKHSGADAILTTSDARRIVESHTMSARRQDQSATRNSATRLGTAYNKKIALPSQLQSVQEESEHSDSSTEKRPNKQASKPSKRSRFQ